MLRLASLLIISYQLQPTSSNYCSVSAADGELTCHSGTATTTSLEQQERTTLSASSVASLSTKLYNIRDQKRSKDEMEHTLNLIHAVERVYNDSCAPVRMAGVCAELSLQLCALHREVHQYTPAVSACRQGVKLVEVASKRERKQKNKKQKNKIQDTAGEFVSLRMRGQAALARAYGDAFQFDNALNVMKQIHVSLGTNNIPNAARWVLMDLHSEILTCSGDVHMSLMMYERAMSARESTQQRSLSTLRRHVELLDGSLNSRPPPPLDVRKEMERRREATITVMLNVGHWENKQQLPLHYVPGLLPKLGPFPLWSKMDQDIHWIKTILFDHFVELKNEIIHLMKLGTMEEIGSVLKRDRECIHGKISNSKPGGYWLRYSPTGYWHGGDALGASGCMTNQTPAACKMYVALNAGVQSRILRVGYSVVGENTWIRPHFGTTNNQLKLHLGLVIPDRNSGIFKCPADLRVGNEVREWESGKVLLFDDSWEHEVYNGCGTRRAVLQVVVKRN